MERCQDIVLHIHDLLLVLEANARDQHPFVFVVGSYDDDPASLVAHRVEVLFQNDLFQHFVRTEADHGSHFAVMAANSRTVNKDAGAADALRVFQQRFAFVEVSEIIVELGRRPRSHFRGCDFLFSDFLKVF